MRDQLVSSSEVQQSDGFLRFLDSSSRHVDTAMDASDDDIAARTNLLS